MDNLLKRTLTGVFIVLFVLGGFWLHPFSFIITGLVLMAGAQYEYYQMIRLARLLPQVWAGMGAGIIIYILSTLSAWGIIDLKWLLMVIPVVILVFILELYRKLEKPFDSLAHTILPLFYIALPFSLFPFAAFSHDGVSSILNHDNIHFSPGIVVGFILLLWVNDTGAYLVGITLGRHRLMERISPKKSWEGFFGGLVTSAVVAWFLAGWIGVTSRTGWLIVSVIISSAGTYGDLVESMLKRSIGVKDSGAIMPGHGGFLDRFDSVLLSFPPVFLYITLFG